MSDLDSYRATHARARGFIDDWRPQAKTRVLLDLARSILDEYAAHLPLTVRQVFYRLVAKHGFQKTEHAYASLGEHLNTARRAGVVPFEAIRDDGFARSGQSGFDDADTFIDLCHERAARFTLDRQQGQPERLAVWCEARGMVPQLERVARVYGVEVFSSGGFDSVSVKHDIAREFAAACDDHDAVRVLHVGDHDPSGVHLFLSLAEDVQCFARAYGGVVHFERIAVLPEHVGRYHLVTAPPKLTDRRAFHGETTQCEALPPDVLADLLRDSIEAHIDTAIYDTVLDREAQERARLLDHFARFGKA
ncbi:hypothetical protein [Paraburkholderia guartelaensis]|uniref:hypothetical protein n=1 Tax=Paraburkholderia guartelaensis TaxID=2546446 RepID=UPI002AB72E62|nr:hypothetical protein [Paraburkholderia guartelaensis]